MYKIHGNNYHKRLNLTENDLVKQTTSDKTDNKNSMNKDLISSDSVEVNQKNENVINTKKAFDAFKEANNEEIGDMSFQYAIIKVFMEQDGIQIPDFTPENSTKFLPFIDKMKDYAKNLMTDPDFHQYGAMPLTNDFLDFCDSFKEKLIQYGCK